MNIFQLISAIILAFTAHFHVTPPPAPTPTVTVTAPAPTATYSPPAPAPSYTPTQVPQGPPTPPQGGRSGGVSPVPTGEVYCTYERMLVASCANGGIVYVSNADYSAALAQDPNDPGAVLSHEYPLAAVEYP